MLNPKNNVFWKVMCPLLIATKKRTSIDGHFEHVFHIKSLYRLFMSVVCSKVFEMFKEFSFPLIKIVQSKKFDRYKFFSFSIEKERRAWVKHRVEPQANKAMEEEIFSPQDTTTYQQFVFQEIPTCVHRAGNFQT